MAVKNGDFIRINFTESVDGKVIDTTDRDVATTNGILDENAEYKPRMIVVGAGLLVQGFEEDLIGKEVGYSGKIEVPPEKGFGDPDPRKIELVQVNKFKDKKPYPGMRVQADGKYGTVTRIIGRKVSVDFNHPLAGKTIVYDYSINEMIEDRQEKLKNLINTFARVDLESEIKEDVATIVVPWELGYYHKEWMVIRRGLADMILQHLGLKEVDYLEKHTGAKISAELISPPGKEGETDKTPEVAQEVASQSSPEAAPDDKKPGEEAAGQGSQ